MEDILQRELRVNEKLQNLEVRKRLLQKQNGLIKLTEIETPEDLGTLAEVRRIAAKARNAEFIQSLEIESAKLHTKRLCPIDSKLHELKSKLFHS